MVVDLLPRTSKGMKTEFLVEGRDMVEALLGNKVIDLIG